jgi:formylglycine-generating enzyme required for sulfatase activity
MQFVPVPGTEVLFCQWHTRVQDFESFVKETGHYATRGVWSLRADGGKQRGDSWQSPGFVQTKSHPVCGVSWEDAKSFCNWLTVKERTLGKLTGRQQYRLPMDWEWSVAVGLVEPRDGTPASKNLKIHNVYPWGTQWPMPKGAGNYAGSEARDNDWPIYYKTIDGYRDDWPRTSPVGSFTANRFGLFDMGGNLWQWCEDWYDESKKHHVLRGASWLYGHPDFLLSSFRDYTAPDIRNTLNGFRCVLVIEPKH